VANGGNRFRLRPCFPLTTSDTSSVPGDEALGFFQPKRERPSLSPLWQNRRIAPPNGSSREKTRNSKPETLSPHQFAVYGSGLTDYESADPPKPEP
jgi:hypothetical protein